MLHSFNKVERHFFKCICCDFCRVFFFFSFGFALMVLFFVCLFFGGEYSGSGNTDKNCVRLPGLYLRKKSY